MEDISHDLRSFRLAFPQRWVIDLGDEDQRMASRGRGKKNVERSLIEGRNSISDDKDSCVHCLEATIHTVQLGWPTLGPHWALTVKIPCCLRPHGMLWSWVLEPWKVFPKWRNTSHSRLISKSKGMLASGPGVPHTCQYHREFPCGWSPMWDTPSQALLPEPSSPGY